MYKIGILGHGPEQFSDKEAVQASIHRTLTLLSWQYPKDMVFAVGSEIGVEHWAIEQCLAEGFKYHIYLPSSPIHVSEHWYTEQQQNLERYFKKADCVSIAMREMNHEADQESYKQLINGCNFLVAFWAGKKQGRTADAIRYALSVNKLTLNGLNDLKLITNNDFAKRKISNERK